MTDLLNAPSDTRELVATSGSDWTREASEARSGVLTRIPNEEESTMNDLYDCDADMFLGRPLWFEKHPSQAEGEA